jgi:hypothetical protein
MFPSARRFRELLRLTAVILAAWTVAALFFATQNHFVESARGRPDDFRQQLIEMLTSTVMSALLTPFVLFLVDRFPLRRPVRKVNVLVLIGAVLAYAAVRSAMDVSYARTFGGIVDAGLLFDTAIAVFHAYLLLACVIVAVATLISTQREAGERRRREAHVEGALTHAKLHQLRADLHPHFLFNTLNAVAALLHTDPAAAERTIAKLSELLRRSFRVTEELEIPLAEELEFLETYLALQKTRFGERLGTRMVVHDRELFRAVVPPLIVQPLVENAILHGVTKRPLGGVVEVDVRADGETLHIEVRDDGPGSDPATIFARGNIGVSNTAARLESLYGDRQSLSFRFDGHVFVAAIAMPLSFQAAERIAS